MLYVYLKKNCKAVVLTDFNVINCSLEASTNLGQPTNNKNLQLSDSYSESNRSISFSWFALEQSSYQITIPHSTEASSSK